jgi:addiction module HigA family antidote
MASQNDNHYSPDYVSPPGETLLDILEERQMSQAELARRMGRPNKTINEIVRGKVAITSETALQLEHVLGTPANFWNRRERHYRAHLAEQAEREQLQAHTDWVCRFPLKHMVKLGWIDEYADKIDQIRELLSFFGVASPAQWEECWAGSSASYRLARSVESQPEALAAWLRQGEIQAQHIPCRPYAAKALHQALIDVRRLTTASPDVFVDAVQMRCAEAGVAVVFVPQIPGASVSGATRWLSPQKALIQLSLRYKTDDQLWFSFFHEAGHILLHGKRDVFLEEEDKSDNREREADRFAAETLISQAELDRFLGQQVSGRYPSKQSIRRFAAELGIAPGIVVGRLQHDGHVPFTHYHDLKRRFTWS